MEGFFKTSANNFSRAYFFFCSLNGLVGFDFLKDLYLKIFIYVYFYLSIFIYIWAQITWMNLVT